LAGLRRHEEASKTAVAAGEAAEAIGWWRMAARAHHLAALETLYRSATAAVARWRDLSRVADEAQDPGLRATALEGLATTHERSGDVRGAVDDAEHALAIRRKVGEPRPWGRAEAVYGGLLLRAGR